MAIRRKNDSLDRRWPETVDRIARLTDELAKLDSHFGEVSAYSRSPLVSKTVARYSGLGWHEISDNLFVRAGLRVLVQIRRKDPQAWEVSEWTHHGTRLIWSSRIAAEAIAHADRCALASERGAPVHKVKRRAGPARARLEVVRTELGQRSFLRRQLGSDDLKQEQRALEMQVDLEENLAEYLATLMELRRRLQARIDRLNSSRENLVARIEARARSRQNKAVRSARLARAEARDRGLAATVRGQIGRSPDCPYCASPLVGDAHLDHIYPRALGGLSVKENLVFVCATCNLAKRDDTLVAYIERAGLNRDVVFERLRTLGKRF